MAKADTINYVSKGIITVPVTSIQSLDSANVSRDPGIAGMTNPRYDKDGKFSGLSPQFLALVKSLVEEGYNMAKGGVLVVSAPFKGEKAKMTKARKSLPAAIEDMLLSKSGHLLFEGPNEKPDRLDKETLVKAAKENYSEVTPEWVPVQGNCRLLAILMANPVRVAQGKAPITEVDVEVRDYNSVADRDRDCVRLNEVHNEGKQKTSTKEKIKAAFHLSKKGIRQRDLQHVFGTRAVAQFFWSLIQTVRYLGWVMKDKANEIKEALVSGDLPVSQNHQKDLHERRLRCEHTDFSTKFNKSTFLGTGKVADAIKVKAHIQNHPDKTVQPIADYYDQIADPNFKPAGRVKPLPRDTVINLAADLDEGPLQDVLRCIANNDSDGTVAALQVVSELVKPIKCRKATDDGSKGELTGRSLSQDDFDRIMGGLGVPGYPQPATA